MHSLFLMLVGLSAGIGITAVGPGGVLSTVGLVHLTSLSPAANAGTVMTTNIANGIVGTAAYARSGRLKVPTTRKLVGWGADSDRTGARTADRDPGVAAEVLGTISLPTL